MNRLATIVTAGSMALLLALGGARPSAARIKLVAVPDRAAISLSIEHAAENLVSEERVLTLQQGVNLVDFNWQGVNIDPDAISLEALEHPGEINLISVKYPPGENALVWEIYAPRAMTERVRVTYFLQGIGREHSYRAISDIDEKVLEFKEYVLLRNHSGERLERAGVRTGLAGAFEMDLDYGEARQRLVDKSTVTFKKEFTWNDAVMPDDPSREDRTVGIPITYVFENNSANGLGEYSLRSGKIRIFQDDGSGGTAFLGEDWGAYTPVNEEVRLNIGESRDIKVTRKKVDESRLNERRNQRGDIVLFDRHRAYEVTVENFRDENASVVLIMHCENPWEIDAPTHEVVREDYRTYKFVLDVPPADSILVGYSIKETNLR